MGKVVQVGRTPDCSSGDEGSWPSFSKLSKQQEALILAWKKGYTVNEIGEIFSKKGHRRKLRKNGGYYCCTISRERSRENSILDG